MSNAVTISGNTYTVTGTVTRKSDNKGIVDLHVLVYDKDNIGRDDFLAIGVTDPNGQFVVTFESSQFSFFIDRKPDLYFIVKDAGTVLLNTKSEVIQDADENLPPIHLEVDLLNDKLRKLIREEPAPGWVGGFAQSNPAFAYPSPDLSSLAVEKNRTNIPKLQRQQKVLWPEFSWETQPGNEDPKRCYQMFAPDISRLGYTDEGKVYSIICPQQGASSPHLGSMNVEVTVTGNRGWVDESTKELAADMSVEGRIWFSPSAHKHVLVQKISQNFKSNGLRFPSTKADAIVVTTFKPGEPDQPLFPLTKGSSTDFPIPNFAKHEDIAWSLGHLGVEIGPIKKTGNDIVDKFNQMVLDAFNTASGNMLKEGNILTWNVWFTAPEVVDQKEWTEHTEKWRKSIDADHGSPEGEGTDARYFDGTPYKPLKELIIKELPKVIKFIKDHLKEIE
ncbi:MAG: hypothetical protein P1U56_25210 [Saprospiraceae bacterium]|nr:hypothetical protein [Saprospiraceae bacterium]